MLRLSIWIGTLGAGLCLAFLMFGGADPGLRPLSAAEAEQVVAGQSSSSCPSITTKSSMNYGCTKTGCTKIRNMVKDTNNGPDKVVQTNCLYDNFMKQCGTFVYATPKCGP